MRITHKIVFQRNTILFPYGTYKHSHYRYFSKEKITTVRGMHDLSPEEFSKHNHVVKMSKSTCSLYGYHQIETPILEHASLFLRSLGADTDVVIKEMYTFEDLSGNKLALRPENTAGVMRAFIEWKGTTPSTGRYFYEGPMFRYERPQKGRSRQFHQIGVECIGEDHYESDAEIIEMASHILNKLNIKNIKLELNSLGDTTSRQNYKKILTEYLQNHKQKLSQHSLQRLERGSTLRILDSKDLGDKEVVKKAPLILEALSPESLQRFNCIQNSLKVLGVQFEVNPHLVRGLDYYSHTVFEFVENAQDQGVLGSSQGTVLAGGRYDGLAQLLSEDNSPVPAIGWAAGVERIIAMCPYTSNEAPSVAVIAVWSKDSKISQEAVNNHAKQLTKSLRHAGVPVSFSFEGNATKQLKRASKYQNSIALLVGESEIETDQITIKDLKTGKQEVVARNHTIDKCLSFITTAQN